MKYLVMLNNIVIYIGLILFVIGVVIMSVEKLFTYFDLESMPIIGTIIPLLIGWAVGSMLGPLYTFVRDR